MCLSLLDKNLPNCFSWTLVIKFISHVCSYRTQNSFSMSFYWLNSDSWVLLGSGYKFSSKKGLQHVDQTLPALYYMATILITPISSLCSKEISKSKGETVPTWSVKLKRLSQTWLLYCHRTKKEEGSNERQWISKKFLKKNSWETKSYHLHKDSKSTMMVLLTQGWWAWWTLHKDTNI